MNYEARNFLEVSGLRLRSELILDISDLDTLLFLDGSDEGTERVRTDWRNLLSYRIGLLTAELEADLFQRDKELGYLALLRLRRDFAWGF